MSNTLVWGKVLCSWCECEATTTVVQMRACKTHHDEYHRRRQTGEQWLTIEQDFWRRRWASDDKRRALDAEVSR